MKHLIILLSTLLFFSICSAQNQPGLHIDENHTVVFGQDTTSSGIKLLWYPSKAAFRAGRSITTEWTQPLVGPFSTAFGSGTEARGIYSSALGLSTWAFSYGETSVGRYSLGGGNLLNWVDTDALFEVGNGTAGNRSNALTVYKSGNTEIQNSLQIGDHEGTTPNAGTIQYNSTTKDYEAWNSDTNEWQSLTQQSGTLGSGSVKDIDGNEYLTVKIGPQIWMRENLRVTRYRNGDQIEETTLNNDWAALNTGAWCWYNNDFNYEIPFGKLYNWYAIDDQRNICPAGWVVPSLADWQALLNYVGSTLGGKYSTNGTLESGQGNWISIFLDRANETGFSGQPAGFRDENSDFGSLGNAWGFWQNSETDVDRAVAARYDSRDSAPIVNLDNAPPVPKKRGYSVRCLKN